jgi:hypothetical protein
MKVVLFVVLIQIPFFFPIEIVVIFAVISVFSLIYFHLSRSLDPKKNIYLSSIENKIAQKQRRNTLSLYRLFEKHNVLDSNGMFHDRAKLNDYLMKEGKGRQFYMSLTLVEQEVVDRFLHLESMKIQLEAIKEDIKLNKKSKFRLRDLQRINDNVEILDEIYEQRITTTKKRI